MAASPRKPVAQSLGRTRPPVQSAAALAHTADDQTSTVAVKAQTDLVYGKVITMFGPRKKLGHEFAKFFNSDPTPIELHELIATGLPSEMLTALASKVHLIPPTDFLNALGVSVRTLQRRSHTPRARLSKDQSGRMWKFAEVLAKATEVFGSQSDAEKWMNEPAVALDQRRPIDLLGSPVGVELVEDLLGRIEYGVYT